jgi:hypothetical protein
MSQQIAKIIVYAILLVGIAYDSYAFVCHKPTITEAVRVLDYHMGTLLRWTMLAV